MLFIGKCSMRTKRQILSITDFQEKPLSSTYLGAPLIIGTSKRQHFNQLLERFLSKLSGWKSRLLSFAGRRILLRHVLNSLATHIAMVFPLPKSESNHLESHMRNFLWSVAASRSRRNQIRWELVCLPTHEGGLGITRINEHNEASFLKLAWTAATSNSLWADWMTGRCFHKTAIWSSSSTKIGSCIWLKVRNSVHYIQASCKWTIGNGKLADIWFDYWAKDTSLAA